ncbi:MAG: hypothetical protein HQL90_15110 [Magnetococcales bacterium]|nr:hypothetical protein [Magnetococcales bacterium]
MTLSTTHRPGTLNLREVEDCMNNAIAQSGQTRWHIAATMSELTGDHITKMMLDAWTAPSKPRTRFPFQYAAAFQVATNSRCLEDLLVAACGRTSMDPTQVMEAALGRIHCQEEMLKKKREALLAQLGGEGKKEALAPKKR